MQIPERVLLWIMNVNRRPIMVRAQRDAEGTRDLTLVPVENDNYFSATDLRRMFGRLPSGDYDITAKAGSMLLAFAGFDAKRLRRSDIFAVLRMLIAKYESSHAAA